MITRAKFSFYHSSKMLIFVRGLQVKPTCIVIFLSAKSIVSLYGKVAFYRVTVGAESSIYRPILEVRESMSCGNADSSQISRAF
jgi:hypothetical protein